MDLIILQGDLLSYSFISMLRLNLNSTVNLSSKIVIFQLTGGQVDVNKEVTVKAALKGDQFLYLTFVIKRLLLSNVSFIPIL